MCLFVATWETRYFSPPLHVPNVLFTCKHSYTHRHTYKRQLEIETFPLGKSSSRDPSTAEWEENNYVRSYYDDFPFFWYTRGVPFDWHSAHEIRQERQHSLIHSFPSLLYSYRPLIYTLAKKKQKEMKKRLLDYTTTNNEGMWGLLHRFLFLFFSQEFSKLPLVFYCQYNQKQKTTVGRRRKVPPSYFFSIFFPSSRSRAVTWCWTHQKVPHDTESIQKVGIA